MSNVKYTFDANLELKDAGLVAASAAAQVSSADKVVDLGAGRVHAVAVLDVSAVEVDSGNELYTIHIQGSNSASFASGIVDLASMEMGDAAALLGDTDSAAARYELPFINDQGGTIYRYVRAYTVVAGTIATGINYTAWIGKVGS